MTSLCLGFRESKTEEKAVTENRVKASLGLWTGLDLLLYTKIIMGLS